MEASVWKRHALNLLRDDELDEDSMREILKHLYILRGECKLPGLTRQVIAKEKIRQRVFADVEARKKSRRSGDV